MIKTLIADDDLKYTKYILNTVLDKFNDINVSYIATDGQEVVNAILKSSYDLVFLDLNMPKINGIDVLKSINNSDIVNIPKFIIISGDLSLISAAQLKYPIFSIINKTDSIKCICEKIERVINDINYATKFSNIKSQIVDKLIGYGYNFKHKGTTYILEAILFIYEHNDMDLLDNLEKNVLSYIAYKNKRTLLNIQTSITRATNSVYIKNSDLDVEPTPKSIISIILIQLFNNVN